MVKSNINKSTILFEIQTPKWIQIDKWAAVHGWLCITSMVAPEGPLMTFVWEPSDMVRFWGVYWVYWKSRPSVLICGDAPMAQCQYPTSLWLLVFREGLPDALTLQSLPCSVTWMQLFHAPGLREWGIWRIWGRWDFQDSVTHPLNDLHSGLIVPEHKTSSCIVSCIISSCISIRISTAFPGPFCHRPTGDEPSR